MRWTSTESTTVSGAASSTPRKPNRIPAATTANSSTAGGTSTACFWIIGCRKLPCNCWIARNNRSVHSAVMGETVKASSTAGIPAMMGPIIGITSSSPAIRPSPPAAGTPSSASPAQVSAATTSDDTACPRSEEHTSELQSLMRISYAVFCLKKKNTKQQQHHRLQALYEDK